MIFTDQVRPVPLSICTKPPHFNHPNRVYTSDTIQNHPQQPNNVTVHLLPDNTTTNAAKPIIFAADSTTNITAKPYSRSTAGSQSGGALSDRCKLHQRQRPANNGDYEVMISEINRAFAVVEANAAHRKVGNGRRCGGGGGGGGGCRKLVRQRTAPAKMR